MDWIYKESDPILQTVLACLLIVVFIILITRIVGLRSFAKFTTYDFAITVAVGSIVSSTLTSSTTLAHGSTAIGSLLLLTLLFSFFQKYSKIFSKITSNPPLMLMENTEILYENLASAGVQEEQLIAKLREANVLNFEQVCAVVLESTGDISVLHKSSSEDSEDFEERMLLGVSQKGRKKS